MTGWRLLIEAEFQDGAGNMAADCAILEAVSDGRQPPTLRLYGWQPFCLSLGYGQRVRDVDRGALDARGWQLVRRPTGGKAILHGSELTYSLCLPLQHRLAAGGVIASYRQISRGLLRALGQLGLQPQAQAQTGLVSAALGPVCFEMPSHYEITFNQRKLVGSAQLRRKAGILQHGTLPLAGDLGRICDVLAFESAAARERQKRQVRARALTLAAVMGRAPAWTEVAAAVERGFALEFDVELRRGALSDAEALRRDALRKTRFAHSDWTHKR